MDGFNNPRGIFVTDSGNLYVADQNNRRVVELGPDGSWIRYVGEPTTDIEGVIPEGFRYRPRKIAVTLRKECMSSPMALLTVF